MIGPLGLAPVSAQPNPKLRQQLRLAQWLNSDMDHRISMTRLPQAPRDVQRRLRFAERAIADGRFAEAIEALDELQSDPDQSDYFLAERDTNATSSSLRGAIDGLLGAMPVEARKMVELQFGADARRLLNRALKAGDIGALQEISRRYFHTAAGQEATYVLARFFLDQAQPMSAVMALRRLRDHVDARAVYEPEITLLLAVAWHASGQSERAVKELQDLATRAPETTFSILGEQRVLPRGTEELATFLDQLLPAGPSQRNWITWTTPQGDSRRDRRVEGGMPLPRLEWTVPISLEPAESKALLDTSQRFSSQEIAAPPAMLPLVAADFAILRTYGASVGTRLTTGKRTFLHPSNALSTLRQNVLDESQALPQMSIVERQALEQRMWEDAVHGQTSTDGRRLYFVTDLMPLDPEAQSQAMMINRGFGAEAEPIRLSNRVVALDLAQEGKTLWEAGREAADEPKLDGAFFLGPPLPVGDSLYAVCEVRDEIRLVALDPASGKLMWAQQLLEVEPPFVVAVDQSRRFGGAVPSYLDGILVCPTSSEVVVALDASTRTLLWSYRYPRARSPGPSEWDLSFLPGVSNLLRLGERWLDSTAILADDSVILTPLESGQIHCLDLLTGKPRWSPRRRGDGLFVGGVHQGVIAVVERRRVRSHLIRDGNQAWPPLEFPHGASVSGRGFVSGKYLFLPTTSAQLLKIDLETGELAEQLTLDFVLGNLTCAGPYLVSYAPDAMRVFLLRDRMRDELVRAAKETPDDPRAMEAYANLLLGDGKTREAIEVLERCLQAAGEDANRQSTRRLLFQSLNGSLQRDFAGNRDLLVTARKWARTPEEQRELARTEAEGLANAGAGQEAFDAFLRLALTVADGEGAKTATPARTYSDSQDPELRLSEELWIAHWIERLLDETTKGDAALRDNLMRESLKKYDFASSLPRLRAAERLLPHESATESLRLEAARLAAKENLVLEAELRFSQLARRGTSEVQDVATGDLAALFHRLGDLPRAAKLLKSGPQASDDDATQPRRPIDPALVKLATDGVREPQWLWPAGQLQDAPTLPLDAELLRWHAITNIDLLSGDGPMLEGRSTLYDSTNRQLLILGEYGQLEGRVPLAVPNELVNVVGIGSNHARAFGDLLVFGIGSRIVAVSVIPGPEQGRQRVVWQKDIVSPSHLAAEIANLATSYSIQTIDNPLGPTTNRYVGRGSSLFPTLGPISPRGFCCLTQAGLECLDPLTGESLWRRRDVTSPCELFGDDEYVYAVSEDKRSATIYSIATGRVVRRKSRMPDSTSHWARRGRFVVAFQRKTSFFGRQSVDFEVFDAWEQATVWKRNFSSGTKGCLVGMDELAIIDGEGKLQVCDLFSGTVRWETDLELKAPVTELEVLRSRDRYVALVNHDTSSDGPQLNRHGIQLRGPVAGGRYRRFTGQIVAADRESGKLLWPRPAVVNQYFLPSLQPSELPVLPLYRSIGRLPPPNQAPDAPPVQPRIESDLVFMDLATGGIRRRESLGPMTPQGLMLQGSPKTDTLALVTQQGVIRHYQVTETPLTSAEPVELAPVLMPPDPSAVPLPPE